jgi:hypothetical protein
VCKVVLNLFARIQASQHHRLSANRFRSKPDARVAVDHYLCKSHWWQGCQVRRVGPSNLIASTAGPVAVVA